MSIKKSSEKKERYKLDKSSIIISQVAGALVFLILLFVLRINLFVSAFIGILSGIFLGLLNEARLIISGQKGLKR